MYQVGAKDLPFKRLKIIAKTAITSAPASFFTEASPGSHGHNGLQESPAVQSLVEHTGGRLTDEEEDGNCVITSSRAALGIINQCLDQNFRYVGVTVKR